MTDWLLALVPAYGAGLLALSTFFSCVALPVPASILMLAAGGFVASGDLAVVPVAGAALGGAVLGDQLGYAGGRLGGAALLARIAAHTAAVARAADLLARRGGAAVFLSRWLVSALGPYVNVAAGAARQPWILFTVWGVAGEAVWVGIYVGLGYVFAGNLEAASGLAVDVLGMLAAGAVAIGLAVWLVHALKRDDRP